MSGPKRNPDRLNTISIVVVGICSAVLVYVSIVALQAFYMNDTSEVQTMADYGGQDTAHTSLRATQVNTIDDCAPNAKPAAGQEQTYRIPIKYAIKLVADEAKQEGGAEKLVPTQGPSTKPTIQPIFGRPRLTGGGAPTGTTPTQPADATMTPTGGQGPGGGQPPGQGPTPSPAGPPSGTGAADPNPTGSQTPSPGGAQSGGTGGDPKRPGSTPIENKAGSAAPAGGNPPTPAPKVAPAAPKAGATATPKATPKAPAPKTGSAGAKK